MINLSEELISYLNNIIKTMKTDGVLKSIDLLSKSAIEAISRKQKPGSFPVEAPIFKVTATLDDKEGHKGKQYAKGIIFNGYNFPYGINPDGTTKVKRESAQFGYTLNKAYKEKVHNRDVDVNLGTSKVGYDLGFDELNDPDILCFIKDFPELFIMNFYDMHKEYADKANSKSHDFFIVCDDPKVKVMPEDY